MYVLGQMVRAVKPGGLVLDLQAIRPNPLIEAAGRTIWEIDGEPLFRMADAAAAAVDALMRSGKLEEQAYDEHNVLRHYDDGADLIEAFSEKRNKLPPEALPTLRTVHASCVVRERCRLRRLLVTD